PPVRAIRLLGPGWRQLSQRQRKLEVSRVPERRRGPPAERSRATGRVDRHRGGLLPRRSRWLRVYRRFRFEQHSAACRRTGGYRSAGQSALRDGLAGDSARLHGLAGEALARGPLSAWTNKATGIESSAPAENREPAFTDELAAPAWTRGGLVPVTGVSRQFLPRGNQAVSSARRLWASYRLTFELRMTRGGLWKSCMEHSVRARQAYESATNAVRVARCRTIRTLRGP